MPFLAVFGWLGHDWSYAMNFNQWFHHWNYWLFKLFWVGTHPDALTEQWAEVEKLLASGRLPPPEPAVYPREEAAAAIASLENRTAKGKVVLRVRD
ncbi:zinc-binding dehydrogenase [Mycobacterium sp.]|uniref:zinc-binding dehydrogenase n=1 Tax=Mycobacterium sp. TaxID=1785 RepID=UPI003BAFD761